MSILSRIRYDGVGNSIKILMQKVQNYIYRKVTTKIYDLDIESIIDDADNSVSYSFLSKGEQVFHLSKDDVSKRIDNGGKCIVMSSGKTRVGYIWLFDNKNTIPGVGEIDLKSQSAVWVGPTFISKQFRGNGLNRMLVSRAIKISCLEGKTKAITSINSNNTASIRSFEKLGFKHRSSTLSVYKYGKLIYLKDI